ncbi:MAG: hypothetical protein EOO15_02670 [Chitinophagaceae bacterium]|nr:MAG: hypothetical protein EOO15_02670 [Chitinophagaceae bacterium]
MKSDLTFITLDAIEQVEFFKRDELTTDLVCCDIVVNGQDGVETWSFHEEASNWGDVLKLVEQLPGFDADWRAKVIQPPLLENRTRAFLRPR